MINPTELWRVPFWEPAHSLLILFPVCSYLSEWPGMTSQSAHDARQHAPQRGAWALRELSELRPLRQGQRRRVARCRAAMLGPPMRCSTFGKLGAMVLPDWSERAAPRQYRPRPRANARPRFVDASGHSTRGFTTVGRGIGLCAKMGAGRGGGTETLLRIARSTTSNLLLKSRVICSWPATS